MSIVLSLLATTLISYWILKRLQRFKQLRFIATFAFPSSLKQKLAKKRKNLTEAQIELVMQGLRDYFYICHRAQGRMVAMPSQVVDDVWHEFILSTRSYQEFCQKALGRFLHHTPAEAMRSRTQAQEGIKRAWRLACAKAKINPKQPHTLPLLFALDSQLQISNGFRYDLNCQGLARSGYCAADIGCSSGCSGDSGDSSDNSDSSDSSDGGSDGGCGGGGCGGGD